MYHLIILDNHHRVLKVVFTYGKIAATFFFIHVAIVTRLNFLNKIHYKKIHIVVHASPSGTSYSFFDHVIRYFYFNRCQDADRIRYGIYIFSVSFTYLKGP